MNLSEPCSLPPPCNIAGVHVHPVRLSEVLERVVKAVETRQRMSVMYANAHAILLAQQDDDFKTAINQADLVFCDGNGVRLASWLLGRPLPARFTPPDWIDALARLCLRKEYRLFLLGAEPDGIGEAARNLRVRFPSLQITTHHGYFEPYGTENEAVLEQINEASPDVLLVGMGMPRQELWILENLPRHSTPVVIAVGALFDYLAGRVKRGPRYLTDHGLEWLCRLWFEPRRLWRRYLLGNPLFLGLILREWWLMREGDASDEATTCRGATKRERP